MGVPLPTVPGILEHFAAGGGAPVKTRVLKAIRETVEATLGDGAVAEKPQRDPDLGTCTFPMAVIFDGPVVVVWKNRVAMCRMPVDIQLWFKDGEFAIGEQADWVEALLHERFVKNNEAFKEVGLTLLPAEEASGPKFYWDDEHGGTTLHYDAQFAHLWGDPYTTGK